MLDPGVEPEAIEIVRATDEDWRRVREVRLRALADAPYAFGSRLDDEQHQPESFWRERFASSELSATFLACGAHEAVGLARVFLRAKDASGAHLVSMWVAPQARGRGLGRALVESAVGWARRHEATSIDLWVTETNGPARRLYASCGFVDTGDRQPLPSDPSLRELAMELDLGR